MVDVGNDDEAKPSGMTGEVFYGLGIMKKSFRAVERFVRSSAGDSTHGSPVPAPVAFTVDAIDDSRFARKRPSRVQKSTANDVRKR